MDKNADLPDPLIHILQGNCTSQTRSYLSAGVLKLCSPLLFADLHSVLDEHEPPQQTSDRKNETEPLGLCQASQFILLPHAAGERWVSVLRLSSLYRAPNLLGRRVVKE